MKTVVLDVLHSTRTYLSTHHEKLKGLVRRLDSQRARSRLGRVLFWHEGPEAQATADSTVDILREHLVAFSDWVTELLQHLDEATDAASLLSSRFICDQFDHHLDTIGAISRTIDALAAHAIVATEAAPDGVERRQGVGDIRIEAIARLLGYRAADVAAEEDKTQAVRTWLRGSEFDKASARARREVRKLVGSVQPFGLQALGGFIAQLTGAIEKIETAPRHCCLLIDRAGGGKTNLVCDLALDLSKSAPTLIFFGKESFVDLHDLVGRMGEALFGEQLEPSADQWRQLDELLAEEGIFLHLLFDGINESRDIIALEQTLIRFLAWSEPHRKRVTVTCRDIYWAFFDEAAWKPYVHSRIQHRLYQFNASEYASAVPLYLHHFRIDCTLVGDARLACQHPLLLRFFCEAYGTVDGPTAYLGRISDIRLKALFDIYFGRKMEQIRIALRHRNVDLVTNFLLSLVEHMFKTRSVGVSTMEIAEVAGCLDISTEESIYVRFLDEDIIIEEEPAQSLSNRRVNFVYEEFMEYLLARSLLAKHSVASVEQINDLIEQLMTSVGEWINARGVTEYVVVMLSEACEVAHRASVQPALQRMVDVGGVWLDGFWAALGKLGDGYMNPHLYDLLPSALAGTRAFGRIHDALQSLGKYSETAARQFACAVLWSAILPHVLTWVEVYEMPDMDRDRFDGILERLTRARRDGNLQQFGKGPHYGTLLEWIVPHMEPPVGRTIREAMKRRGRPKSRDLETVLFIIHTLFPEHNRYLVNGVFLWDEEPAGQCADRLRFVDPLEGRIGEICRVLARVETRDAVRRALLGSADYLDHRAVADVASREARKPIA